MTPRLSPAKTGGGEAKVWEVLGVGNDRAKEIEASVGRILAKPQLAISESLEQLDIEFPDDTEYSLALYLFGWNAAKTALSGPQVTIITPRRLPAIPARTVEALHRYIGHGIRTGDFMYAVLTNDFAGAVLKADDENLEVVGLIMRLIIDMLPMDAWGSVEKVEAWMAKFKPKEGEASEETKQPGEGQPPQG